MENVPPVKASSGTDLNNEQDGNDEIHNVRSLEDGAFTALRSNYERQALIILREKTTPKKQDP